MPIGNQSDVHVDAILSNLVLDYGRNELIGNQILPKLVVDRDTGLYYVWDRDNINISGLTTRREDQARANKINLGLSTSTYTMEQHALGTFLPDTIRKNQDNVLKLQQRYSQNVIDIMDLVKEKAIRDTVFTAATYASTNKITLAGNDRWNQVGQAASDPKEDITNAQIAVHKKTGVWPASLVLGVELYMKLRRHTNVLNSLQYVQRTGINYVSDSELMDYLGVTKLYVGKAVYNASVEGVTASNSYVWNQHALLFYESPNLAMEMPNFGFQFYPSHTPRTVSRWRENGLLGEDIEVNEKRFMKLTFPDAGYLFIDADG